MEICCDSHFSWMSSVRSRTYEGCHIIPDGPAPPTIPPTPSPTKAPVTSSPTASPTHPPTKAPVTESPTGSPTVPPPTSAPSKSPSRSPSQAPTKVRSVVSFASEIVLICTVELVFLTIVLLFAESY